MYTRHVFSVISEYLIQFKSISTILFLDTKFLVFVLIYLSKKIRNMSSLDPIVLNSFIKISK